MLNPYVGYLIVEEIEKPKLTKGGIILPDTATEQGLDRLERGRVLAESYQVWDMQCGNAISIDTKTGGIIVWYPKHAGYFHTDDDGKRLRIIQHKDIVLFETP